MSISKIDQKLATNLTFNTNSKLKSIGIGDCNWTGGFWADKFKTAEEIMVPYMGDLLCGDVGHALNNFKIAAGLKEGEHKGMFWHDGDFYKFIEAKTYIYAYTKNASILSEIDEYISIISQAQEDDGYLQTQIQLRKDADRYENRKYHEMYNTGHLLISACIHHNVTGQNNFLNIAIKHADLLHTIFKPETKHFGRFGFNQTQIMGLVELYRTVGDAKYLRLAEKFINNRGKYEVKHDSTTIGYPIGDMVQERTPLRESKEAVGHAVLALYYYAGAADVYSETGEQALLNALDLLWDNVTQKKMYVTGAVGQAHYGASANLDMIEEGFIDAYMMPNMTAYNETCANLCNAMFSYRMFGIHGESKYMDIIELVLYNSGLSGISVEGKEYFYANPLRMINNTRDYEAHENVTETPNREPYLECFCCPPNLVRTISKVSGWAYSVSDNGVSVNLYGSNHLKTNLSDGTIVRLTQETDYPWNGRIKITVQECKTESFEIAFRIPGWAKSATLQVNGEPTSIQLTPGTFARINRVWKMGDVVLLDIPMEINLVEGHPRIEEVRNQIAIKRGPVVYCIESPDLPKNTEVLNVYFNCNTELKEEFRPEFLGGVSVVKGEILIRKDKAEGMYQTVTKPQWEVYKTQFVPYFAWSNRGQAEMTVFMPVVWE
ncbi:glycoside hydrolase family 127 protein [Maribacter sp. BPC-D8]|uniref:glycoside hydrolase family 127 protein n=1 Tax=Maribacter sp. BPC-D8 TaxID=3053613 RepID=UPI002B4822CA|nr:beta-L-arabinofuranosidase domain-containing protein [Maribacter sp. BPC-D8]WRI29447.1 glycoside hydrolase family 127 protein [Maribacter sp. BPC-D8]